jgi:hypothetical protein
MSDPREFDRNPNMSRDGYVDRSVDRSDGAGSGGWIIAGVVAVVLLGLAAYSYRDTETASSSAPPTTMGQSTRAPVPNTPPATPVAPAPKSDPAPKADTAPKAE